MGIHFSSLRFGLITSPVLVINCDISQPVGFASPLCADSESRRVMVSPRCDALSSFDSVGVTFEERRAQSPHDPG